jgi:hypothetical protein
MKEKLVIIIIPIYCNGIINNNNNSKCMSQLSGLDKKTDEYNNHN